jgi:hypothetical protein
VADGAPALRNVLSNNECQHVLDIGHAGGNLAVRSLVHLKGAAVDGHQGASEAVAGVHVGWLAREVTQEHVFKLTQP